MTQELQDKLQAAFAAERFTMTVSEVETRAGLRRKRFVLRLAGVSLAVGVVVAAGFLFRPTTSLAPAPPAATPSASVSPGVDLIKLEQECAEHWRQTGEGPMPPKLTQRQSGGVAVLFFGDETTGFACTSSGPKLISNPEREPADHSSLEVSYLVATGGETIIFGWTPPGTKGIAASSGPQGHESAEIIGSLFFLWDPSGRLGKSIDGITEYDLWVSVGDQTVIQRISDKEVLPAGASIQDQQAACEQALNRLPQRGTISSAPPLRFSSTTNGQSTFLFGNSQTLVKCGIDRTISLVWSELDSGAGPFHQISKAGSLFGQAPEGAVSGEVKLSSGRTVALSLKDGFYKAGWDLTDVAVRVQVDTATERWVYEGGQTTRTPR